MAHKRKPKNHNPLQAVILVVLVVAILEVHGELSLIPNPRATSPVVHWQITLLCPH